jgi:hypothetical protein
MRRFGFGARRVGGLVEVPAGVIGRAYAELTTYQSTAAVIAYDDTIPQNTEGAELMTLAYTPADVANRLRIEYNSSLSNSTAGSASIVALFQDTTADALSTIFRIEAGNRPGTIALIHEMGAGTTSLTTFKIRFGASSGTARINGDTARKFGGAAKAVLMITEFTA